MLSIGMKFQVQYETSQVCLFDALIHSLKWRCSSLQETCLLKQQEQSLFYLSIIF